ncbi:hypothetical protein BLSTO_06162 [Blastocystis sp. subtype 1]
MSYNQYRLESIDMGDASACAWRLGRADLQADLTVVENFELVYQNSIKDIELDEMYSNSVFTLTLALPAAVHERRGDPVGGVVHGQSHQRREVDIPSLEDSLLSMCVMRGRCGCVLQRSFGDALQPGGELRREFGGDPAARRQPLPHRPLFRVRVTGKNIMALRASPPSCSTRRACWT